MRAALRAAACVVLVGLVAGGTSGCTDPSTETPTPRTTMTDEAQKSSDGEQRSDLEPLTSRIPTLEGAESATWYSGTLGDADVPGPSLYWIDAVVTLPAGAADELRATLDLAPVSERPAVVPDLAPHVPADLVAGPALDEAFSSGSWRTTAYLDASGDDLVLVVVGE